MDQGKLGIALILCGRKALGLQDVWSTKLDELTAHKWEQIKESYEYVERYDFDARIQNSSKTLENTMTRLSIA